MHIPKLTGNALLYFEGRSLILVLNTRQRKLFFCVLACYTCI